MVKYFGVCQNLASSGGAQGP